MIGKRHDAVSSRVSYEERVTPQERYSREICDVGRRMYESGLILACAGNLSIRLDAERILTTPACANKGKLTPDDLVTIDLDGRQLTGERSVSSEVGMHLLFYRMRPDVQAVCHAHPPTATAIASSTGLGIKEIDFLVLGKLLCAVPLAPYATPGTDDLSSSLEPHVRQHSVILLANHGVVTCGPNLFVAFQQMAVLEQQAKIILNSCLLNARQLSIRRTLGRFSSVVEKDRSASYPCDSDRVDRA